MSRFFTESEVANLQPQLVDMLDKAREFADVPFVITSGLRTESENLAAGGVEGSAHMLGLAVDLRCSDSINRFKMLRGLIFAGFNRIGIYKGHLHADVGMPDKFPQNVAWLAENKI